MEPSDLKSSSPDDAQLEAWLRSRSAVPPVADEGFSARVLAALPPPAPRRVSSSLRGWLCLAGALIGAGVAWQSGWRHPDAAWEFADLLPNLQAVISPLSDPNVLLAVVVAGMSLAFVYWRELRTKLNPLR